MDVLSKMLDRAAGLRSFGYHPQCKNLGLTHLSFADDLMVLSDGKMRSIEGILEVFDSFAIRSRLRISMEKSIVYLAGVTDSCKQEISDCFQFGVAQFPVVSTLSLLFSGVSAIFGWLHFDSHDNVVARLAKIAWGEVCTQKSEGGLGLRSLKETNDVCCLKLIWRLVSKGERGFIDLGIGQHQMVAEAWSNRRRRRH
ncbi:PREDICTED: uncharacterized protein LOC104772720 [Camelina sativa]|uniref:Uncharacterized protein LOC104772720 n=1 Tax=Camelina sativa TaxID=90675 RepID=A0ABM0Y508_CAMSA|nr:PREDICTED: uncharacterized protein LOC104772720 [Camelina sativa]